MATLYEYNQAYKEALGLLMVNEEAEVVNEDGEIINIADYIKSLEGDIHDKIEGTILFTKELESDINGLKAEMDALKKRYQTKQNLFDRLRKGVADTMLELGETKMETSKMALSFRKSETVEIDDTFELPQKYIKKKIEEVPDKVAIKKALKDGEVIEGATLMVHQNLQVR